MLELIARKTQGAAVTLNLARQYLDNHEWGRARILLQSSMGKCEREELEHARHLLYEACQRLGLSVRDE